MITHAELIDLIERHIATSGETATAFGKRVANDSNLLRDLKAGRSPRLRLVETILESVTVEPVS